MSDDASRSPGGAAPLQVGAHASLPAPALRKRCDPGGLGFETSDQLQDSDRPFGQERAVAAVRFAVSMDQPGYNVFAVGPSGVGKHATVETMLAGHAASRTSPNDWIYVENFARPSEPRALPLPPGKGQALTADVHKLVEDLRAAIPAAFETREYAARLDQIQREFQARHEALFSSIEAAGAARGVAVLRAPAGVVFAPIRGGEVIGPDEFEKLPSEEKDRLRETVSELQKELSERVKELPRILKELRDRVRDLEREVTRYAVDSAVEELLPKYADLPRVVEHLEAVRADVVEHAAEFRREKEDEPSSPFGPRPDRRFTRYSVNLLVDHGETQGAPVVYDDRATYDHLVGRIEHYAELGNLVTNFSLIKSGSLHRANGGYLLLDARKVLTEPYAWSGLKRALLGKRIDVEPLSHWIGVSSAESLRPAPIPLEVKVVLFGPPEVYYLLSEYDPEFVELFKVEAEFEDSVERTPESEREFARMMATLARHRGLRPLSSAAVAFLVEEASRLASDARKLSTNVRRLFGLAQEAEHFARQSERSVIDAEDVRSAVRSQVRQRDRLRDRLIEAVRRKTILIDVAGRRVGQVNGLAAISLGEFTFGRPTRITATARIGEGRVIDIEREVELGGPLHSKGVLILTNYLAERYAKRYPLSLSASLVFEQSYAGVEGDSASLAELCALLSALAEVPAKQSIALTGSVNQWGEVQAIGAVNEKIEGFYDTCRALGLDGEQGVIVPRANIEHLMLREDVAEAAARGELRIYPVDTIDDAMELLTDMPAGNPGESGESPEGTLSHLIEQQLIGFAVVAKRFGEFFQIEEEDQGKARPLAQKKRSRKRGPGGTGGRL